MKNFGQNMQKNGLREKVKQLRKITFPILGIDLSSGKIENRDSRSKIHGGVIIKCFNCGKIEKKKKRRDRNLKYCSRKCYQENKSKPYVAPKSKRCSRCKRIKKIDEFYFGEEGKNKRWKHEAACKKCRDRYSYEWRIKNPEKYKQMVRRSAQKCRIEVLTHYSHGIPKCSCCGEREIKFLQIDHINGGGSKDRKKNKVRGGQPFYYFLKRNNYPKGFQVLCANCNLAKWSYGQCPHKQ